MFNEAIDQDPTVFAIPVFIACILIEAYFDFRKKLNLYNKKDTIACISMGLGVVFIGLITKTFYFFVFHLIYQFKIIELENTWWMWILLLFADDFSFYWHHRMSHQVRFLWAAHIQHHSSTRMNFSVALRQSWMEPFYKYIFYLWIPLLGFNPLYIFIMQAFSLIYQFFQHTELVRNLGPIGWVFNTPSHHRVHHAVQYKYLDRNHAGILIIWDRLFGTFVKEDLKDLPVYGITENIKSYNPAIIATHEYVNLWRDIKRANRIADKLKYLFYPPGWSHDGENRTSNYLRKQQ
ncbi:MAG: sterol desaturase family protein [Flavobacteriales bacterium]|jgi:sterol desaturase/sphingolipid hydroxylase (fatty acid hydroxylase superfamily)|nr:sterol desaturase family protein [Flavobacteriales bacterium]